MPLMIELASSPDNDIGMQNQEKLLGFGMRIQICGSQRVTLFAERVLLLKRFRILSRSTRFGRLLSRQPYMARCFITQTF